MRSSNRVLLALLLAAANGAPALAAPLTDTLSTNVSVSVSQQSLEQIPLQCRQDYRLVSTIALPDDHQNGVVTGMAPTDAQGAVVSGPGSFPGAPYGARFSLFNGSATKKVRFNVRITCARYSGQTSTIITDTILAPGKFGSTRGTCPAGEFAVGGGYREGPTFKISHYSTYSTGAELEDRPVGVNPPPDTYEYNAVNTTSSPQVIRGYGYCYDALGAQMWIGSLSLAPGERRFVAGALGSQLKALGVGGAGGSDGLGLGEATWQIGHGFSFTNDSSTTTVGGGGLAGVFFVDVRTSFTFQRKAYTPVAVGIVYVPTSDTPPPVTIVVVIEFYNAALDHYFVTSIPQEISDLDNGVHPGWKRTGQTFNAYASGSGGPTGRAPVCRYYGSPAAGLDSHFYTASALECLDVGAKFAGAWLLESGEVFQINLPDIYTGMCPAGTVAVYRLWNQRVDSNHRYTTSTAIRLQMLAKGYLSEGYGPDGVALCAQP